MLGDEKGKGAYGRVNKGFDIENGDIDAIKQVSFENIAQEDVNVVMGDHHITLEGEDHETTCWGCGLRLVVSPYAPVFKCGWCGAITNHNAVKHDNKYIWWRRLRDRSFVSILIVFMLFFICGGIWATFPVVFSISYVSGVFHISVAVILSVSTIFAFSLAAFRSAGAPPIIEWGSYPAVGKGGLDNYSFCQYCSKPKSPRTHHCRSCETCVLDMDHHCPFIGNCVGAENHRCFIMFLMSAVISNIYVSLICSYAAYHIWPALKYKPLGLSHRSINHEVVFRILNEVFLSFLTSTVFVPARGLVLVYLVIASVSVGIGLSVLLWQQLRYIYEGKTYLGNLKATENEEAAERDCQNFVRFFGCPYGIARYFPSPRKSHAK